MLKLWPNEKVWMMNYSCLIVALLSFNCELLKLNKLSTMQLMVDIIFQHTCTDRNIAWYIFTILVAALYHYEDYYHIN